MREKRSHYKRGKEKRGRERKNLKRLLHAVVVVAVKEAVDLLRLIATEQLNVALDNVRGRGYLLLGYLS